MPPAQPVDAPPEDEGDAHRRLLLVALPDSVVALPADVIVEILPARPYAVLPGADSAVAGVVNQRGRILTVVDLGLALGERSVAADAEHRVVVVAWQGRELGLAVNDVLQIASDWWTDSSDEVVDYDGEEMAAARPSEDGESGGDEQLRVVEPEAVLAPLFGGNDAKVDANEPERS